MNQASDREARAYKAFLTGSVGGYIWLDQQDSLHLLGVSVSSLYRLRRNNQVTSRIIKPTREKQYWLREYEYWSMIRLKIDPSSVKDVELPSDWDWRQDWMF